MHVQIDGMLVGQSVANVLRADVTRAFPPYGGRRGFRFTPSATLAKGTHSVCVYAINTGAGTGNPLLACHLVTVA